MNVFFSFSFSFPHSIHLKMENSLFNNKSQVHHNPASSSYIFSCSSQRHVRYSCGTCGYELNLSSSNRSISSIGSKYGKSIKRGIISFFNVDDSRFTRADEVECAPFFSKHSWGLFRRKTKLLCRKCCNHVGYAYNHHTSSSLPLLSIGTEPSPTTQASSPMKYDIRIRALQPSSQEHGITVSA